MTPPTDVRSVWDVWPKHFVYLSPPKANALFAQIPNRELKSLVKGVNIDLKVLTVELGPRDADVDPIFARLRVVLRHLQRQGMIGDVDSPNAYFAGSLPMRWGAHVDFYDAHTQTSHLSWFSGRTARTMLGMGGSSRHVIGTEGNTPTQSRSDARYLVPVMRAELGLSYPRKFPEISSHPDASTYVLSGAETAIDIQQRNDGGFVQNLEFVAKRLSWGPAEPSVSVSPSASPQVLLGTPLYVALAD